MSPRSVPSSWLFIRRNETVRVFRPGPPYLQLAIAGPQGLRRTLRFDREEELQTFQRDHEQQLMKDGWRLEGVDVERRSGTDRRRMSRGPERRASDQESVAESGAAKTSGDKPTTSAKAPASRSSSADPALGK